MDLPESGFCMAFFGELIGFCCGLDHGRFLLGKVESASVDWMDSAMSKACAMDCNWQWPMGLEAQYCGIMPGKHFLTLGNEEQIHDALNGTFLKGRREPRVAMVGRSNVGKSSLINALLGGRLAQVSKEPGKTRLLHFYDWPETKRIVADLPGYGYARASAEDRNRWAAFIQTYIERDEALERALVLVDARHGPTDLDIEAIRFLQGEGVQLHIVFSKWDTLKTQSERAKRKREAAQALQALRLAEHQASWVSSETGFGLRELTRLISTPIELI